MFLCVIQKAKVFKNDRVIAHSFVFEKTINQSYNLFLAMQEN